MTVATNKTRIGAFRGVGRPAAVFAMERMMDETAAAIGIEPHEFRLRHMIDAAEHPYVTATSFCYDSGDYKPLPGKTLAAIDVAACRAAPAPPAARGPRACGDGVAGVHPDERRRAPETNSRRAPRQ